MILGLAPYFEADLRREWAPMLTATDASSEFGFGASVAPCTQDVARQVGRLAEIRGAYVRLTRDGGPTDEPERQRLGQPHRLHLSKRAFKDVLSMGSRRFPRGVGSAFVATVDLQNTQASFSTRADPCGCSGCAGRGGER